MQRKSILLIVMVLVVIALAGGAFWYLHKEKMKADIVSSPAEYLLTSATVSYQDEAGNTFSSRSGTNRVRKVNLVGLKYTTKGRDAAKKLAGKLTIIDQSTGDQVNLSPIEVKDAAGVDNAKPDWTGLNIDAGKSYDLRLSAPGYLSRLLPSVTLDSDEVIDSGDLHPGDLNDDRKINWQDYAEWKSAYGQIVVNDPRDFNGDGKIDFYDFAVSFGSRCYNATESNQDTQCAR